MHKKTRLVKGVYETKLTGTRCIRKDQICQLCHVRNEVRKNNIAMPYPVYEIPVLYTTDSIVICGFHYSEMFVMSPDLRVFSRF